MQGRAFRLAAFAAAFFVLSASSCATSQLFKDSGAPQLQAVGDSITVQSTIDINARFGPAYDVAIDASIGADTYLMASEIAAQVRLAPAVELINLGTNDAGHIQSPPLYETGITVAQVDDRLDTFAREFPTSTCVVFVTVNTHTAPSWGPSYAQQIDSHMRSTYAHVADWDASWQAAYFDTAGGVHPNEAGRQALLVDEDQAIEGCSTLSTTTTSAGDSTTSTSVPDSTTTP